MDLLISILIFAAIAYFNSDKKNKSAKGSRKGPMHKPAQKPKLDLEDIFREISKQMGVEIKDERPPQEELFDEKPVYEKLPKEQVIRSQAPMTEKEVGQIKKVKRSGAKAPEAQKPISINTKAKATNNEQKRVLAEGMLWSQILGEPRSRKPYKPLTLKK